MLLRGDQSIYQVPCFTERDQLDEFESVSATRLGRTPMGAAYFSRSQPNLGRTIATQPRDLFLLTIMLKPVAPSEMWRDDRPFRRDYIPAGGVAILDHRSSWSTILNEPFELFDLYVPVIEIVRASEEMSGQRVETLRYCLEETRVDPIVYYLAMSLFPIVRGEHPSSHIFVEHVFEALVAHLVGQYGCIVRRAGGPRGGLSPSQLRKAQEIMTADLRAEARLSDLSAACGLSNRHFLRAFRTSTGQPPHRWLLERKVERAKDLLAIKDVAICDVADMCGFADQSHLTRMFKRVLGITPAAWRRLRQL